MKDLLNTFFKYVLFLLGITILVSIITLPFLFLQLTGVPIEILNILAYSLPVILIVLGIFIITKIDKLVVFLYSIFFILVSPISFLSFIKEKIFSIIEGHYKKSLQKALFKAKNFLRPIAKQKMGSYCFANKNCIVELDDNEIRCYDKININAVKGILSTVFKPKKDILFALCNNFNFDTTYEDVLHIVYSFENRKLLKVSHIGFPYSYKLIYMNNISVAELICLPGINMGKAYKIHKYLRYSEFSNVKQFIDFADISLEDADELLKLPRFTNEHFNKQKFNNKNKKKKYK